MKAGSLLPAYEDTLTQNGETIDLTEATAIKFRFRNTTGTFSKEGDAEVVDPEAGTVRYDWESGDTDEIGSYRGNWVVQFAGGIELVIPSESYVEFEIIADADAETNIDQFIEPIRVILNDHQDPLIHMYSAAAIKSAVRMTVNMGKIPEVTIDGDVLTPAVVGGDTNWARIVLYSAWRFVIPNSAASSVRMRALAETFGEARDQVFELLTEIYDLENGEGGE